MVGIALMRRLELEGKRLLDGGRLLLQPDVKKIPQSTDCFPTKVSTARIVSGRKYVHLCVDGMKKR